MPINKKTIFTTNTIGGILLIIGMQLLNLIVMIIGKLLFSNVVIYTEMMLEIFLEMTITYIFVYTITNIAMSISGNIITQIVVTALIAFLVPFVLHATNDFYMEKDIRILGDNGVIDGRVSQIPEFTLPYGVITNVMYGESQMINYKVIVKTLILSIVYFFIGRYLFEKRKMENTEESFSNVHMHSIIKLLTLVPVAYLYDYINIDSYSLSGSIIIIVMSIIYWFIYDLLTKKRIKFKYSMLYLILGTVILEVIVHSAHKITSDMRDELEVIGSNEISKISIDGDYYFKDEGILEDIFKSSISTFRAGSIYSKYTTKTVYIKLNDDRVVRTYWAVGDIEYRLSQNEEFKNNLKQDLYKNYDKIQIGKKIISNRQKDEIIEEIKQYVDNMDVEEYLIQNAGNTDKFNLIGYKNHNIYTESISIELNNEIFKKITKISNENMKEVLNNKDNIGGLTYTLVDKEGTTALEKQNGLIGETVTRRTIPFVNGLEYINEHYQEECSMEKSYYVISTGETSFYTNNIEDVQNLMKQR